jgi:SAM-dependent methyltransferase
MIRNALERRVRQMPPARRLRLALVADALERFAAGRPLRLLDAGSEEGLLAVDLGRRHAEWVISAVDVNEDALARGRAAAREAGVDNVRFERRDVATGVGKAEFDAVAAVELLAEVEDDDAVLAAMAAALRPGGLLVLHAPRADWEPVLRSSPRTWARERRHGYMPSELTARLRALGLDVVRVMDTTRGTVHLAQEIRERFKRSSLKVRAALYPLMLAGVWLERRGVTWGSPRAMLVEARREA